MSVGTRSLLVGVHQYRQMAARAGVVPLTASHRVWFRVMRERFRRLSDAQRGDAVSYHERSDQP